MERVRCLIIGSGPAGYTAAIYASRAGMSPVVYEGIQPGGQLTATTEVENFPGYPQGVSGIDMMEDMKQQALRFGADVRAGTATGADLSAAPYKITIDGQQVIETDALIIATGASAKYLGLPDEQKYAGQGVSACATCDGFFYRKKNVAVVGGGDTACEDALYLSRLASQVWLIVRKPFLRASKVMQERVSQTPNIRILFEHNTLGLFGENGVEGARLVKHRGEPDEETVEIAIDGFFLAIGHTPNSGLFKPWLETDENGYILTRPGTPCTALPGVFAAGDVADPVYRQAVTAAASGCRAAIEAERYLNGISSAPTNDGDAPYDESQLGAYDPRLDLSGYRFPTPDLLKIYDPAPVLNNEEQDDNKKRIRQTLEEFGIHIESINATAVGPTLTLYEVVPAVGVLFRKIRNLVDDIVLRLSVQGIRIIAPLPGTGTIGIEVPNKHAQMVSMHSLITSRKFNESKFDLPIALGRTITNDVFMFDLCKAPHLLIAGATGQGKSVGLHAIITSLLYRKHPAEMKLILVDPKMVEFSIYSKIERHYLAKLPDEEPAIITDCTRVVHTLNSLCKEIDDRYELLTKACVRDIRAYNEKFINRDLNPEEGHRYMPYIVVVIDEFGDLILQAGKEIEMPIARIAQKARAIGIHMIIATQRLSTNIITGNIKANFPARIAFRVSQAVDSRMILDQPGANNLIGCGDLLFSSWNVDMMRIQCAFVDTPEVEGIASFIGRQPGYASAYELPEFVTDGDGRATGDVDPLFEDTARLIVIHQQGSTSLIQRRLSIDFARAGRLMDQLERAGIVGPTEGSKARQVLIPDEDTLNLLLSKLK